MPFFVKKKENSQFASYKLKEKKDENVHRFTLSAIRGELLEKEIFWDIIHGLPIIHSKD